MPLVRKNRLLAQLGLVLVLALILAAPAFAQGSGPDGADPSVGGPALGTVLVHGAAPQLLTGNLVYHGGPTMHVNTAYAIYWIPAGYTVSPNYVSLINGFFQNVALANGQSSNVYFSDTQYYDSVNGNILYNSTFGGSYMDTTPYPKSGCTDPYTSVCLSDYQIRQEVSRVKTATGWQGGQTNLFFVFTPKNVGSCSKVECAYTVYCAYHSWYGTGASVMLYANMPYASFNSGCESNQHPNGDDADATINVISHEHNEAITDEQGSAWSDRSGNENGDKCAWNFGSPIGSTQYGEYNQLINGVPYYLQQEWSNASRGCVLTGQ